VVIDVALAGAPLELDHHHAEGKRE